MKIVRVEKLIKEYKVGNEIVVRAVDEVSLNISDGEFVSIMGVSGSGKTTLLNLIGGLDTPTSGNIIVNDKNISELKEEELAIFRRRNIGFIFQDFNLIPTLNVYDNIVLPIELDSKKVDEEYVDELLVQLGIESKKFNIPSQLSGGQQQRVAIARALANKPSIILADEPTGNLDSLTTQDVVNMLRTTSQKFKQTVLMITHDEEIAQVADRIIHIIDGKIKREEN